MLDPHDYYSKYAKEYYDNTVELSMEMVLNKFTELINEGSSILDLGCGSGRDSLYFIEKGFDITALDASKELCELAEIHIGQDVLNMRYEEMEFEDVFDGVWACAALVHEKEPELSNILKKIIMAMKEGGYLYMSFKYGDFEGIHGERYFKYFKTKSLKELVVKFKELEIIDIFKTPDIREERENQLWINIILKKVKEEE